MLFYRVYLKMTTCNSNNKINSDNILKLGYCGNKNYRQLLSYTSPKLAVLNINNVICSATIPTNLPENSNGITTS